MNKRQNAFNLFIWLIYLSQVDTCIIFELASFYRPIQFQHSLWIINWFRFRGVFLLEKKYCHTHFEGNVMQCDGPWYSSTAPCCPTFLLLTRSRAIETFLKRAAQNRAAFENNPNILLFGYPMHQRISLGWPKYNRIPLERRISRLTKIQSNPARTAPPKTFALWKPQKFQIRTYSILRDR